MNCHDFEAIACELAREQLMDAAQREKALAHSASCARCEARLADGRALTSGLRFVATAAKEAAPARVQAALLVAFRQQQAEAVAAPPRIARRRWLYAAASVAAIALIVMLLALMASRTQAPTAAPQNAINPSPAVPGESRSSSAPQQTSLNREKRDLAIAKATERRRKSAERSNRVERSKPAGEDPDKTAENAEIVTDFIPLMNREALAQMDGGQVMRVELPRSAMMSFGLPMDMERASERVKADVLVGNDGLARAIRFVR